MARDLPSPTPEGVLIRRARKATRERLTIPEAAERAGISPETWGHMERGYKPRGKGQPPAPYTAQEDMVAHAARVVGLTVRDLEEAGRPDAAAILAQMQPAEAEAPELKVETVAVEQVKVFFTVDRELPEEDVAWIRQEAEEWGRRLLQKSRQRSSDPRSSQ